MPAQFAQNPKIMLLTFFPLATKTWTNYNYYTSLSWEPAVAWFIIFSLSAYSPVKCAKLPYISLQNMTAAFPSAGGGGQNWWICPATCSFTELSHNQNHMNTVGGHLVISGKGWRRRATANSLRPAYQPPACTVVSWQYGSTFKVGTRVSLWFNNWSL